MYARMRVLLASCGFVLFEASAATLGPVLTTTGGSVRGVVQDDGVEVYRGLPFAAPPVGSLRWREPQPPAPWDGVRVADQGTTDCVQGSIGDMPRPTTSTSEDCLYLTVWKPVDRDPPSRTASRPVMVWIFGGGFQVGSGNGPQFDGSRLARRDVVVVVINYRVGILGFLVHPELTRESPHHASGNYGLLDQIAALKWVQANAAAFGGDPTRVTVFGQSAGSTAISILQASPLARGLFRRAIGESTSELDPAAGVVGRRTLAQAESSGVEIATALGANSLADLRALPAETLARAPSAYWPIEADGYVLPREVHAIFAAGQQNAVDLMVGSNAAEGTTIKIPWVKPDADELPAYRRLYADMPDHQIYTDVIAWQMRTWATLHARSGQAAYLYWFDHAPPASAIRLRQSGGQPPGAFHGAEVALVFGNLGTDLPWTETDRRLSDLMMTYWVNFARTGDPNGPGLPHWPRYDPDHPRWMRLADVSASAAPARADAQAFLDRYFAKRGSPPYAAPAR